MRRVMLLLCGLALLAVAPPAGRAAPAREPVIVIPGIAGSEFVAQRAFRLSVPDGHGGVYDHDYPAGEKVWVNVFQVALPGGDDYFDALKLMPDGRTPAAPDLAVSGLYESTYGDLVGYLERQGYALGRDLFLFPYDWRRDLRDTADLLDAQVSRALVAANGGESDPARWSVRQVDLVAHSMGGVLGRLYVSDAARARRVDQLITFGSPQLGAPKLLKTALYGDDFGTTTLGLGLSPAEVKDLVQNMPGALGLLPSRSYYALYDNDDAAHLSPLVEDRDLDGDGVAAGPLGSDAVRALLPKLELNRTVLDIAGAIQGQLDGRRTYLPLVTGAGSGEQLPPHTVRWQALVGFGSPSIGQIREYTGLCGADPCPKHDELPVDGDGTVPLFSAALGDPARGRIITDAAQRWYVERGHTALVQRDYLLGVPTGDGPALEWLGARLAEQPGLAIQGIQAAPLSGLSGLQIAALGPAALRATDPAGQSVGRTPSAEPAPPTWPGASYDRLPNGEFVFLKSWRDGATVELGAERPSTVDLKLRLFQRGQLAATAVYLGLRLGPASRVAFELPPGAPGSPGGWPELRIDADGDGVFEARQAVTALLGPGASGDTTPPAIAFAPPGGGAPPRWSASDAGAGLLRVLTALDGAPARLDRASGALDAPGRHTLRVVAVDRAGNASTREFTWSAP
jgi:hypothetical protein